MNESGYIDLDLLIALIVLNLDSGDAVLVGHGAVDGLSDVFTRVPRAGARGRCSGRASGLSLDGGMQAGPGGL
jgi:hypothetical protein